MRVLILRWTSVLTFLSFFLVANASGQMSRIKVGYSSIGVGQSLVWVAKEAGLFKENGLDVQLIFIGSSRIPTPTLIARGVPVAIMSGTAAGGVPPAGGGRGSGS